MKNLILYGVVILMVVLIVHVQASQAESVDDIRRFLRRYRAYLLNLTVRDLITEQDWHRYNQLNRMFQQYLNGLKTATATN